MARINANLSDIGDDDMGGGGSWSAWPQGDYRMMVTASDYKPTKARNGQMLKLEMVCLEGEHQGQKQFDNLVLEHPNPDATKIARVRLKELAIAVGHPTPDLVEDSEALHGKPFLVYITKKKAKPEQEQYADSQGFENNVAGYKACEGGTPAQAPPPAPPTSSGGGVPAADIPFAQFEWHG